MAYSISDNEVTVYQATSPSTQLADITADRIDTLKTVEQISYLGDELVYDTMRLDAKQSRTFSGGQAVYGSDLIGFPYGTLMTLTNSGGGIDRTFYVDTAKKIGVHAYQYDAMSIIGVLDRQVFGGQVYRLAYFKDVLADIIGASGTIFAYTCAAVQNELVSGWIPYSSKRVALQQLLFATNIHAMWDDANDQVVFDYIDHTVAATVADAKIFNTGKVEYPQLATKITVIEHSFYAQTKYENLVTLYDNTAGYVADNEFVQFTQAPIIVSTLVATGTLTFTDATTDSAVVSGRGTLVGYPYKHTTFPVIREDLSHDRKEYEVSVTDAYLISLLNSENVADRMADYWFNRYLVRSDIINNGESCGKFYTLKDAFLTARTGFLQKMEKTYSSFIKVAAEFLCGVTQDIPANTFKYYTCLYYNPNTVEGATDPRSQAAKTGSWTVPAGVTKIRVVLIGGGQGGSSGIPGTPGSGKSGGKGGAAGTPGTGGNIYIFTVDVTPGEVFDFSFGEGGAGGAALTYATYQSTQQANPGVYSANPHTTFTRRSNGHVYTSQDGAPSATGWYCLALDVMMGKPGEDTSEAIGGDGGNAGESNDIETETAARKGQNGTGAKYYQYSNNGGAGASGMIVNAPTSFKNGVNPDAQAFIDAVNYKFIVGIAGGGGGGGAVGSNSTGAGGAPSNASSYYMDYQHPLRDGDSACWHEVDTNKGGNGGNGGNPGYFSQYWFSRTSGYGYNDVLGIGGRGGFGGGGGGGAASSRQGSQTFMWLMMEFKPNATAPTPGSGGNGGTGQNGSDGGIIIYT